MDEASEAMTSAPPLIGAPSTKAKLSESASATAMFARTFRSPTLPLPPLAWSLAAAAVVLSLLSSERTVMLAAPVMRVPRMYAFCRAESFDRMTLTAMVATPASNAGVRTSASEEVVPLTSTVTVPALSVPVPSMIAPALTDTNATAAFAFAPTAFTLTPPLEGVTRLTAEAL